MACKRCGICCKETFFVLKDVPLDNDTREIGRWAFYHGVKTSKYNIDGTNYLAVGLPGECKYLKQKDGLYECSIYENRPRICKDYICEKSKED